MQPGAPNAGSAERMESVSFRCVFQHVCNQEAARDYERDPGKRGGNAEEIGIKRRSVESFG